LAFPFLAEFLVEALKFGSTGAKRIVVDASFRGNGKVSTYFGPTCPDFAHLKRQSPGARLLP
jgi:hypothetical protein